MAEKTIKVHNKSDKPDNIIRKEYEINRKCKALEKELPPFLAGFHSYLRGNVLPMTRLAYLYDLRFFFRYLIQERPDLSNARKASEFSLYDLQKVEAVDINMFLDYCRSYEVEDSDSTASIHENANRTLARKKSSVSVMFKQLYRDGMLEKNITDGFNPIRVQKPGEREIKRLHEDEVRLMLEAVSSGQGLSKQEKKFREKTKKRDKAILILFLTYGLRISELQQLNVSSFNFQRGEFKIYRKRAKESLMPLNQSATMVVKDYLENERMREDQIPEEHKDALFLSLQGKRMTERAIRDMCKKYTSMGLGTSRSSGYSPHKLRATAATDLIRRGNSIFDVQALLDHEQVTTTQLYAAHRQNAKRDLVQGMEWELERMEENEKLPETDKDKD